ncbi:PRC-barrel domain-containing protein [Yanghanlia caeni]|uniref:PRC-barrel domain-containing protein n=1 Tax=Yanghanlia caeni TaxID=3064283 RepID=A0ABU1D8U5_9BURK|nr:PRC-barrel domain-containing protein [Alcaligenaceae bacterium LG-2]
MNIKTLATAFTVSLPLVLGTAYAQTTTTPDTGNNRAADGASMQTNPTPGASGTATIPGTAGQSDSAASTEAITGWSAKDDIIGKSVFNENDEKVGDIKDVIISSDGRTMYLLVGAGGFLGMGEKEVAVPFDRFERRDDRVLLSGYTKEQLKALPEVRTQR